jgi:hypothetical protein
MNQREIEAFALRDTALALVEAKGANIAPACGCSKPARFASNTQAGTHRHSNSGIVARVVARREARRQQHDDDLGYSRRSTIIRYREDY